MISCILRADLKCDTALCGSTTRDTMSLQSTDQCGVHCHLSSHHGLAIEQTTACSLSRLSLARGAGTSTLTSMFEQYAATCLPEQMRATMHLQSTRRLQLSRRCLHCGQTDQVVGHMGSIAQKGEDQGEVVGADGQLARSETGLSSPGSWGSPSTQPLLQDGPAT